MKTLKHLFENNVGWSSGIKEKDPEFFHNLAKQQTPEYLWIGCSDSRVPATQIVDLQPGEMFVHRNIANLVAEADLSCMSVIEFAVEVLCVKHIIVCGHYGCGGVKASLEESGSSKIDRWISQLREVKCLHADSLESLPQEEKVNRLCELNVIEQVKNVCDTTIVKKAWGDNKELSVHGWIYSIENGMLVDLDVCISSSDELKQIK